MYLNSFNHFRALAIVFIVTGHSFQLSGWNINSSMEKFVASLLAGGTVLFVFISGFFFHHVYCHRFEYFKFMKKKSVGVLIPYLLLSLITLFYLFWFREPLPHHDYFVNGGGLIEGYLKPLILYLLTGASLPHFWYIPFIMIVFSLSPLFILFIQRKLFFQLLLIFLLVLLSMVIHRPAHNINPLQSVIYYAPIYMLGMVFSVNRKSFTELLKGKEILLFSLVLFFAALEVYFYNTWGTFHKTPFEFTRVDLQLPQKVFLSIFFMVWLTRFEHIKHPLISLLATFSFAIYFLHFFIINFFSSRQLLDLALPGALQLPIVVLTVLLLSIVLAYVIKKTFKESSVLIIGR